VDLFCTTDATPNYSSVKRCLLEYYSLLQRTQLSNSVLSNLPLPRTLDPSHPTPLPSRLFTLSILIRDSLTSLSRLPFFLFPLIVHLPVYIVGRLGARLVDDEEETLAQNKVLFGLLFSLMIYPAIFYFLWAFLWYTPIGALLAAGIVWLFAIYHNKLINGEVSLFITMHTYNLKPHKQRIMKSKWLRYSTTRTCYMTPHSVPNVSWLPGEFSWVSGRPNAGTFH
jgi:glycerol-3-phosphate O-acyltransferase/dihydroxyacetone phosphate acyltransferase